jgi:hypothetical protein
VVELSVPLVMFSPPITIELRPPAFLLDPPMRLAPKPQVPPRKASN